MEKFRYGIQATFIALMAYIGYRHQVVGGGPTGAPPLDAYCPFGAVETLLTYVTTGDLLAKISYSNLWIFGALVIVILVSGAVFCGWMCPLGGLSDWLYQVRRRFYQRKLEFSPRVTQILSYGRYLLLVTIIYFSWKFSRLWFEEYDPFKLIFHFNVETATGWFIIGLFILLSLLIERAWCRFFCPLGGIVGLLAKLSWFKIERNNDSCINCKKCEKVCPTVVAVQQVHVVNDTRCIQCFRCVEACPIKETLRIKSRMNGIMSNLKPMTVAFLSVIIFASILISIQASDKWDVKSKSIKSVNQITETKDIKGWMKWQEVITVFGVDEQKVAEELRLPAEFDHNKTLKVLGKEYNFDEEKAREAIQKFRK